MLKVTSFTDGCVSLVAAPVRYDGGSVFAHDVPAPNLGGSALHIGAPVAYAGGSVSAHHVPAPNLSGSASLADYLRAATSMTPLLHAVRFVRRIVRFVPRARAVRSRRPARRSGAGRRVASAASSGSPGEPPPAVAGSSSCLRLAFGGAA